MYSQVSICTGVVSMPGPMSLRGVVGMSDPSSLLGVGMTWKTRSSVHLLPSKATSLGIHTHGIDIKWWLSLSVGMNLP